MWNLIVILLFLNLNASSLSAMCNHTHRSASSRSFSLLASSSSNSATTTTTTTPSLQESDYSNSSATNITAHDHYSGYTSLQTDANLEHSLDELRLEYYKYKIVTHLDISADPDKLNPDLDEGLRSKIASTRIRQERSKTPVINSRQKRSLACSEVKSDKNACCLETFYVNFTEIGWDKWIIYPTGYNANYCRGQCDLSHARYYHSTLLSKFSSVIGLCCSPKQMAPLRLLYIDENNKVLQKTVPDMTAESCDCA